MKVLIADRSIEIRSRIRELIKRIIKNNEIFETNSFFKSVVIIQTKNPDIIISDIELENGSGLTLLRFLRKENSKSLKIIFTNQLKPYLKSISIQLGADYFFFKGHDITKIKNILIDVVNNFNQGAE